MSFQEIMYEFRYKIFGAIILIVASVTLLVVFESLLFPSCEEQISKYEALKKDVPLVPRFAIVKSNCKK